jgi:hypothetical protein
LAVRNFSEDLFSDGESNSSNYRSHFDLALTNFAIGANDGIEELPHFFVLTRGGS